MTPENNGLPPDAQPIERVQQNMLARGERWVLNRLCARMPRWVTPDMLTFTGMVGALAILKRTYSKRRTISRIRMKCSDGVTRPCQCSGRHTLQN